MKYQSSHQNTGVSDKSHTFIVHLAIRGSLSAPTNDRCHLKLSIEPPLRVKLSQRLGGNSNRITVTEFSKIAPVYAVCRSSFCVSRIRIHSPPMTACRCRAFVDAAPAFSNLTCLSPATATDSRNIIPRNATHQKRRYRNALHTPADISKRYRLTPALK